MKMARLDLEVVVGLEKITPTTTTSDSLVLPGELPLIEEELKVLAATLKVLVQFPLVEIFLCTEFCDDWMLGNSKMDLCQ